MSTLDELPEAERRKIYKRRNVMSNDPIEKRIEAAWANYLKNPSPRGPHEWRMKRKYAIDLVEILRSPEAREWMDREVARACCEAPSGDTPEFRAHLDAVLNAACGPGRG